ncbi:hypothetical protein SLITO_v1c07610 [Spiroplasma litorale]|uniref:Uncharacterized protein n=1 Tax=Spiroplasma litorale TaxID=216942 RepID=A0A0K1W240_9MOLU|nr:hypothetical protein [Spiroplasma litorale]AKX34384.1 hypothetical protein SLITO_v1c07610 [Spiroplasma litorale]
MYITLEKNSSGELQIEDQILKKILEKDIKSNIDANLDLRVDISWEQENNLFINIEIKFEDRSKAIFKQNEILSSSEQMLYKTLGVKPKTITISFI